MKQIFLVISCLMVAIVACNSPDAGRDASSFLPELEAYDTYSGSTIGATVQKITFATGITTGNPTLATTAFAIAEGVKCLEKQEAAAIRAYQHKTEIDMVGVAVAINMTRTLSPAIIINCIEDKVPGRVNNNTMQVCVNAWEYKDSEASYILAYMAIGNELCQLLESKMLAADVQPK